MARIFNDVGLEREKKNILVVKNFHPSSDLKRLFVLHLLQAVQNNVLNEEAEVWESKKQTRIVTPRNKTRETHRLLG